MMILGLIAILSLANAEGKAGKKGQCKKEMDTIFGSGKHKYIYMALCLHERGSLAGECKDKIRKNNISGKQVENLVKRCMQLKNTVAEVLPKFNQIENSACLKKVKEVCPKRHGKIKRIGKENIGINGHHNSQKKSKFEALKSKIRNMKLGKNVTKKVPK